MLIIDESRPLDGRQIFDDPEATTHWGILLHGVDLRRLRRKISRRSSTSPSLPALSRLQ